MKTLRGGVVAGLLALAVVPAPAHAAELRAGVGKADVTPRTGYYLGGWTRADRVAKGQHTRLHSRALVLRSGGRKIALVSLDLFMVPSGMVRHIGEALASRGFSERNILISASHTHSGPGGYANYPTFNTAAPALSTARDPATIVGLLNPPPADRQLYTFLVQQISKAIIRADRDLSPAVAGWGAGELRGVTRNRSLEAHLANHGIEHEYGQGSPAEDPEGAGHTIDPSVDVLRVDKLVRRRGSMRRKRVPIGGWSNFADHGTVTKSSFPYYNQDHHASAMKVFEDEVREQGRVPRRQQVLNVYGNSNEGDMSAGLDYTGPAGSDTVGRIEARHMLAAWRGAGRRLGNRFPFDMRWTRVCFCGRQTKTGPVASEPEVGLPFFTGSEEERGPLFDITGEHFEGRRSPTSVGPHGHKLGVQGIPGEVPEAVPLLAVRIGSRVLVSYPGESTKEVGARLRAAVGAAVSGSGVRRVVVSGLANEFILYFTTPEEHDRQHYEGGQTLFGRSSSTLVNEESATLAGRLVRGLPAQDAFPLDPTNGVRPDGPPYSSGAASGSVLEQPAAVVRRFGKAAFGWQGGPQGLDRPVDSAFVTVQRRVPRRGSQARDLAQHPQRPRPRDALDRRRRRSLPGGLGELLLRQARPPPVRGDGKALPVDLEVVPAGNQRRPLGPVRGNGRAPSPLSQGGEGRGHHLAAPGARRRGGQGPGRVKAGAGRAAARVAVPLPGPRPAHR